MKTIRSISQMQAWSGNARSLRLSIGFVPTMGCLHEGHGSLVKRSARENDRTVVSIFVNKLQFGPREDFRRYPRPYRKDTLLLKTWGTDVLFRPSPEEMYPEGFATTVRVQDLDQTLCGPHRPGHFQGVATVVVKLLNAVNPARAYFGLKDYQQVKIIQRLAKDLNLPARIVPCPTVREWGGIALSSRNRYLTTTQKNNANRIFAALQWGGKLIKSGSCSVTFVLKSVMKRLEQIPGARVEYTELVDAESLERVRTFRAICLLACAVRLGPARLIDNLLIDPD
jgi:pantoate--beta-alanine ligase